MILLSAHKQLLPGRYDVMTGYTQTILQREAGQKARARQGAGLLLGNPNQVPGSSSISHLCFWQIPLFLFCSVCSLEMVTSTLLSSCDFICLDRL